MARAIREELGSWQQACGGTAAGLLEECGIDSPPVDIWRVARGLGLQVAFDAHQPQRGRLKRIAGRTAVLIRPEERPEREQWTLAHEIGEAFAHRVFEQLTVDPREVPPQRREQVANAMASSLLLPDEWFLHDAAQLDGDVPALKRIYSTASHELILLNLLKLPELSIASVFDHGRLTRRRGNGQLPPPPPLPLERVAWRAVHNSAGSVDVSGDGVRVQAWAVHEPAWKRELLRATALEGIDAAPPAGDDGDAVPQDDILAGAGACGVR